MNLFRDKEERRLNFHNQTGHDHMHAGHPLSGEAQSTKTNTRMVNGPVTAPTPTIPNGDIPSSQKPRLSQAATGTVRKSMQLMVAIEGGGLVVLVEMKAASDGKYKGNSLASSSHEVLDVDNRSS